MNTPKYKEGDIVEVVTNDTAISSSMKLIHRTTKSTKGEIISISLRREKYLVKWDGIYTNMWETFNSMHLHNVRIHKQSMRDRKLSILLD